jgi:hypothetical protein
MFTGWVTAIFTLQLNVYTVAISSVNKIVINEWLQLNNSGFLMAALLPLMKVAVQLSLFITFPVIGNLGS